MERPQVVLRAEHTEHTGPEPPRGKGPVVERIASWSARHRKTALFGWLLLVAGAAPRRARPGCGVRSPAR
jgi:hypothetical protein